MSTDFRALCAELADRLQRAITSSKADRFYGEDRDALDRARAALAQPEVEGLPPDYIDPEHSGADRHLLEVFYQACQAEGGTADEIHLRGLRAVLADAVLAQPEGEEAWLAIEPPTGDEMDKLYEIAVAAQAAGALPGDSTISLLTDRYGWDKQERRQCLAAARVALARWARPTPQPIPVSERPPGEGDCDAEGACWWFLSPACGLHKIRPCWTLDLESLEGDTHWLPHWALPLPQVKEP